MDFVEGLIICEVLRFSLMCFWIMNVNCLEFVLLYEALTFWGMMNGLLSLLGLLDDWILKRMNFFMLWSEIFVNFTCVFIY